MNRSAQPVSRWIASSIKWLTLRRVRAQAIVLALCLWGICAADFATPGVFDRAGNIKFQDFLQFPAAARLIAQGRSGELYDEHALAGQIQALVGRPTSVLLKYFYGPQLALPFLPLVRFSFLTQAAIWVAVSLLIYFGCIYLLWKRCGAIRNCSRLVVICAIAYPPVFHFFVRGQMSALVLVCITAAYLAFSAQHDWLAGIALGLLIFKPPFLVAIPLVLLLAQWWKAFAGLAVSAGAQLAFTVVYFGRDVVRSYFAMLLHSASRPGTTELALSPIQMHSLHAFWELLILWASGVWLLYLLTSFAAIGFATSVWKSSSPLPLRFSALLLAAALVNPHLYIYDLLAMAPIFLLLADWILANPQHPSAAGLYLLLYLAFLLPLFGPLSRWTHVQLSVIAFAALLWLLWHISCQPIATAGHKLASGESRVV